MKLRGLPFTLLSITLLLCILVWITMVLPEVYHFKSRFQISDYHLQHLDSLGRKALETNDVPVASILLFNDSIIGSGFNTVYRSNEMGGHAEINALSDASTKMGHVKLMALDRDKLSLITTFEPCAMCTGALIEYRIQNVIFVKEKDFGHHLKETIRGWKYQWNKKQSTQKGLQDSLFVLHPHYQKANK